jgi:hypothetical protein
MLYQRLTTICAAVAISAPAYAESPQGYLHCTPTTGEFSVSREIVLYSHTAEVNDLSYTLRIKPDSFVLEGPIKIVADMLAPSSQIIINRITGQYLILNGQQPESGECIKVQRKF